MPIRARGRPAEHGHPGAGRAIDHHLSNGGFATHNFVDVSGGQTQREILSGLFLDNGLPIDAATAQAPPYAGVLTDTGQFRLNSTTKKTFRIASELLERGAHPAQAGYEICWRARATES